jgi:hypothetical protein
MDEPQVGRRWNDGTTTQRIVAFWDRYGRDVWLMLTTITALVGIALALGASSKAQRLAEENCDRGKLVAPLIVEILTRFEITDPAKVAQYKRAVPSKC